MDEKKNFKYNRSSQNIKKSLTLIIHLIDRSTLKNKAIELEEKNNIDKNTVKNANNLVTEKTKDAVFESMKLIYNIFLLFMPFVFDRMLKSIIKKFIAKSSSIIVDVIAKIIENILTVLVIIKLIRAIFKFIFAIFNLMRATITYYKVKNEF